MNRRLFVRTTLSGAAVAAVPALTSCARCCAGTSGASPRLAGPKPAAGPEATKGPAGDSPDFASFDRAMESFMARRGIPGGALAVVKDRRLVHARGYGWADRDRRIPATPDSLFRIASISKPITAASILKLAEQGRLRLDAPALALAGLTAAARPGAGNDSRLKTITVRQLLQHTGGWDREAAFDPMFRPGPIAQAVGSPPPASARDVIRYMLGEPLQFDPGARYAYSNFGYCVLGRILEAISGQPYEAFVRSSILQPCGIRRMRLGRTLDGQQAPGEVRYYTADDKLRTAVFPAVTGKVAVPYGGFHLEAMDAHGGWIASAVDLVRFAAALDDPARSPILSAASIATMIAPPAAPASRQTDGRLEPAYYGGGWMIRPQGPDGGVNFWHNGSLPGTATLLVRRWDHLIWAAVFNQRSEDPAQPDTAIDPALHEAAREVQAWPDHDLFPRHS